jgi:MinD-like ATPase involved in chromosome partitioning or flagellar assembly
MPDIIAVHSFRGGTGKSNTTANLAAILAGQGQQVGVIDTDIQSPGIHVLFKVKPEHIAYSLNDYLWGQCQIHQAAIEVTPGLGQESKGRIVLIPSSMNPNDIARVLRERYSVGLLHEGIRQLITNLALDVLLIDTHPGLNEETLLSIAMSNALLIVMRPDEQDYEGTSVTVQIARKLKVPKVRIVVNKTPAIFDFAEVRKHVETTYQCPVAAVMPHSDELMALSSNSIFALRYPDHPVTELYRQIVAGLAE